MEKLLVITVGGTPQPVAASIVHNVPSKVVFVCSKDTEVHRDEALALAKKEGVTLTAGEYETVIVHDPQGFQECVDDLRRDVVPVLRKWLARGQNYALVVDFTGGTKCMSAAVAAVARRFEVTFCYVGARGQAGRNRGVGVVIDGQEQVLYSSNPWNALGYQAIEDAVVLFNKGHYAPAVRLLQEAIRRVGSQKAKAELLSVKQLISAYERWDAFDHKGALSGRDDGAGFERLPRYENNLSAALGQRPFTAIKPIIEEHRRFLRELVKELGDARRPTYKLILDLLANAKRRLDQERFDDAVARCYRATEALAQLALLQRHNIPDTGNVDPDKVPDTAWEAMGIVSTSEPIRLGMRKSFVLLRELGDELGKRFFDPDLGIEKPGSDRTVSILSERNRSILAHGFYPVSVKAATHFFKKVLELGGIDELELPVFPRIEMY